MRIEAGNCVAECEHGFRLDTESGDLLEKVDSLLLAGEMLKDDDTCHVSRLTWNEEDVVVKRYNHQGLVHSLRHTIKRSRARRAWLYAHHLGALGIATPRPLAYIESRKGLLVWQSYLLTEYVEGHKLWSFLRDEGIDQQQRLEAMRQVVEMLDELWKYGITHGDLKHTNVLITESGPVLTDLDGMIFHRWGPLYRNKQVKDIERFLRKTDVSQELQSYCKQLVSSKTDYNGKHTEVLEKMRIDNWTARVRKNVSETEVKALLSVTDLPAEGRGRFTRVTSSKHARVFRGSASLEGEDHKVYLKQYLCRSKLDCLKHMFRASRAKRALNASVMLRQNRIYTPGVLGLFERMAGPFRIENILLTEDVENARSLATLLENMADSSDEDTLTDKHSLITAFARAVGQMHAKGIFHGDLRLGNVLAVKKDRDWRFFLLDNERTRKFLRLPARLRVKNLVQVNMFRCGISNSDRMRFFEAYLKGDPSAARKRKQWIARVYSRTESRLRRKCNGIR